MSLPTAVHNEALTDYGVAYFTDLRPACFTAFPVTLVENRNDVYAVWDKGDLTRIVAEERAEGSESAGAGFAIDLTQSYNCRNQALHKDIDVDKLENADDQLRLQQNLVKAIIQNIVLRCEKLWADSNFVSGAAWAHKKNGATSDFIQWDVSGSTPIEDINEWIDTIESSTGKRPNNIIFGADAMRVFKDHSSVVDRIKYTQPGLITEDIIASMFAGDDGEKMTVRTSRLMNTTSKRGASSATTARIANAETVWIGYRGDEADPDDPSAGRAFVWPGAKVGSEVSLQDMPPLRVSDFFLRHLKAQRHEVELFVDFKMQAADLGLLAYDVLS